jgi:hypothetical protein
MTLIANAVTEVDIADASSDTLFLTLPPDTLVGYAGGPLCGEPFGSACAGGALQMWKLPGDHLSLPWTPAEH